MDGLKVAQTAQTTVLQGLNIQNMDIVYVDYSEDPSHTCYPFNTPAEEDVSGWPAEPKHYWKGQSCVSSHQPTDTFKWDHTVFWSVWFQLMSGREWKNKKQGQ